MDVGRLVMATHGENTEGFLALLNEVMWRANYNYCPEYVVYAKGVGHGMVDYMARVHILSHLCVGAKSDQQVNICSFAVRCDRMWPSTQ